MDASEVKRIVEAHLSDLVTVMWLGDWRITVEYGPTSSERWAASCDRQAADYNMATITIDPHKHYSEEDVVRTLVHELLHVALAPLDLYRDIITNLTPEMSELGSPTALAEQRAWTHAIERSVTFLERGIARHLWERPAETVDSPQEEEHVEA